MNFDLGSYFDKLELQGIVLSAAQKNWYCKKFDTQKEDMFREYPSTPDEAFAVSQEANWYASQIKELYDLGHITTISYDKTQLVHTAWDLGQADHMAIWFFQINRVGEIMVIDYFQKTDFSLNETLSFLQTKGYSYGTHIWPHDARSRDRSGITFESQARELGINGHILAQQSLADGINLVRTTLSRCWFDQTKCKEGIACLSNYKKRWNTTIGGYTGEPLHDKYSHGADAFRYLCSGLKFIDSANGCIEKDYAALRKYWG